MFSHRQHGKRQKSIIEHPQNHTVCTPGVCHLYYFDLGFRVFFITTYLHLHIFLSKEGLEILTT